MSTKQLIVETNDGVNILTSTRVVMATSKYLSEISVAKANTIVNARNIFDLVSMELRKGDEIVIIADGRDEERAVTAVEEVLSRNGIFAATTSSKAKQVNSVCNCNQEGGCHGCTNCQFS